MLAHDSSFGGELSGDPGLRDALGRTLAFGILRRDKLLRPMFLKQLFVVTGGCSCREEIYFWYDVHHGPVLT